MRTPRLALLLVGAALATPAGAVPYTDSGTLLQPAPAGTRETDTDFARSCPDLPSTNGVDGWVFVLPDEYAVAGTTVTLTGADDLGLHDLSAYVYDTDCSYTRLATDYTKKDLVFTLQDGEKYVEAFTQQGVAVAVDLTATLPSLPAPALSIDVPTTVQYGDPLPVSALLTDASGAAMAGERVTFRIEGAGETSAVTGVDGIARATLPADVAPGTYQVDATFGGSGASCPLAVTREDTTTTLAVTGTGSKRTLTALVSESDDATRRLGGATVTFWADGKQIGSAVTGADGVATFAPTGGGKQAKAYGARFAGDTYYLPSGGSS